jgi:hypothetical protein
MERFEPLLEALTSKFNIVLLALGCVLLADLYLGSPLMRQILLLQLKIRGVDPSRPGYTIITIFGNFKDVDKLANFFDKSLSIAFFIIPGISIIRGLIISLFSKRVT